MSFYRHFFVMLLVTITTSTEGRLCVQGCSKDLTCLNLLKSLNNPMWLVLVLLSFFFFLDEETKAQGVYMSQVTEP